MKTTMTTLRHLQKAIKAKRPGKLTKDNFFTKTVLQHTSPCFNGCSARRWLWLIILPIPLIWPPPNYHLFPNMKKYLPGNQYRSNDHTPFTVDDFFDQQHKPSSLNSPISIYLERNYTPITSLHIQPIKFSAHTRTCPNGYLDVNRTQKNNVTSYFDNRNAIRPFICFPKVTTEKAKV